MNRHLTLTATVLLATLSTATAQTTVSLEVTPEHRQTVTGFGAAALEHLMRPIDEVDIITKAFDPDGPVALNILRIEMSPNLKPDVTAADVGWDTPYDWHGYLPAVREARRHGALILATPWSPPGEYKTNGKATGGQEADVHGKLKTDCRDKLFTWMNTFLDYMQQNGAPVDVVSIQNEPDWWVSYSGCEYTPQEQLDLVKGYAALLDKQKYGVRLMSAEPLGFNPEYARLLMQDADAARHIDILGGHVYGNYDCKKNLAQTAQYGAGREVWMTEHTVNPRGDNGGGRFLPTWHEQLEFVEDVHECLVNGATAYVYWYLAKQYGLIGDGTKYDTAPCIPDENPRGKILDRGYLMGQFARQLKGATRLVSHLSLADGQENGRATTGVNRSFETSAFLRGDSLIVNVVDTTANDYLLNLTLPYTATALKRIQSTDGALCAEDVVEIEPGSEFTIAIPARSFTTLIFTIDGSSLNVAKGSDLLSGYTLGLASATTSLPEGWRCVQENGEVHEYGNSYSQGARIMSGFTGYKGRALYWRNDCAEYGRQDDFPLALQPGSYELAFATAAWKESPSFRVEIAPVSDGSPSDPIARSDVFAAAPNAAGSLAADVSGAEQRTFRFDVAEPGRYVIRFKDATTWGGFHEFLLLDCRLKSLAATTDLAADGFHVWDGCSAWPAVTEADGRGACDLGKQLQAGAIVYGDPSVTYQRYANLTGFDRLAVYATPGVQLRVLLNRLEVGNGGGDQNGGALTELTATVGDDGVALFDLSGYAFAHLNAVKLGWGSPAGTVCRLLLLSGDAELPPFARGDVNADGRVDGADVQVLASRLAGGQPSPFVAPAADVDGNGVTDITDVTALIKLLLP